MAGVNIGAVQSYTIPLDSVDLTYLGKYVQTPHAEKRPLWTRKCLDGESEYCHVQIVTQDDNEDCYSESTDTFKCHICDIHVPTMCYKEHTESEQHEAIKNISQKVLERVSKQINMSVINNDKHIDEDVYYCVPCSKIIKIENKHRHESTAYHVKSKNHISLVSEFYKIFKENKRCDIENDFNEEKDEESDSETDIFKSYKANNNNDNEEKDEESDSEIDIFKSYKANNNYDTTNKNLCHFLDSDDDSVDQLPITDNLMMIPTVHQSASNTGNNIQPTNDEKTESFEEYLKEMIKKYNLKVNVPVINGAYISIVAPNGDTVKVSREHFQSYRQLKNSVYCQLCKMWISQDTKPHDVTEIHVRNILKPINEKFARMVDSVSSHCVPCNEIVLTNSNHHPLNDTHKQIIKDTHTPKTGKTFCEDCNVYIDTHNFAVHIQSKKHLNVLMQQNSVHKTDNNNICYCKICNITVRTCDLKSHVNSKTHIIAKKTNHSTEINNINNGSTEIDNKNNDSTKTNNKNNDSTKTNNKNNDSTKTNNKNNDSPAVGIKINDSGYCEACKVKVPSGGWKIHDDGKPHKKAVSELCSENKIDIKPKENKDQSGATPGSVAKNGSSVSSTPKKVSFASTNSKSSTGSSLSYATNLSDDKIDAYYDLLEFTDLTRTKVRCKICLVNIDFVERNIIEHMEGRRHVENANTSKMAVFNKMLFFTDDAKTKVKCEICDVNIPYLERNIIEHMEGRNHEAAENELLVFHLVTRESSGYYCECCEVDTADYFEHINSKAHTCKYLDKYEIDKNEMRKYVYDEDDINNCVARRHRERYRNLLKYNDIFKINDTNYYCGLCQIKLGRISEIDHVLGDRHALKLEEINKLNTLLNFVQLR